MALPENGRRRPALVVCFLLCFDLSSYSISTKKFLLLSEMSRTPTIDMSDFRILRSENASCVDVPIPVQPLASIQLAALTRLHVAIGDPEAGIGHEGGMYWAVICTYMAIKNLLSTT